MTRELPGYSIPLLAEWGNGTWGIYHLSIYQLVNYFQFVHCHFGPMKYFLLIVPS